VNLVLVHRRAKQRRPGLSDLAGGRDRGGSPAGRRAAIGWGVGLSVADTRTRYSCRQRPAEPVEQGACKFVFAKTAG
jgi:hypothetical protein